MYFPCLYIFILSVMPLRLLLRTSLWYRICRAESVRDHEIRGFSFVRMYLCQHTITFVKHVIFGTLIVFLVVYFMCYLIIHVNTLLDNIVGSFALVNWENLNKSCFKIFALDLFTTKNSVNCDGWFRRLRMVPTTADGPVVMFRRLPTTLSVIWFNLLLYNNILVIWFWNLIKYIIIQIYKSFWLIKLPLSTIFFVV